MTVKVWQCCSSRNIFILPTTHVLSRCPTCGGTLMTELCFRLPVGTIPVVDEEPA